MSYSNNISHLSLKVNDLSQNNLDEIDFTEEDYLVFDELSKQDEQKYLAFEFSQFVEKQQKPVKPKTIYTQEEIELKNKFFALVPDAHKQNIQNLIKKKSYQGDLIKYIRSRKLFFECFTDELKKLADGHISEESTRSQKRLLNKRKKEALLYASQLLGLIGKGVSHYIDSSLLNLYIEEIKKQERFVNSNRLINSVGAIKKIPSVENKQRQKVMQITRISKCLGQLAKDKGMTFLLVTLTLPPHMHPAPSIGQNSFSGVMPLEAHAQLHHFWRLIRSHLSKANFSFNHEGKIKIKKTKKRGEQEIELRPIFGLQTVEAHVDSTLHLHSLLYINPEDIDDVVNIINKVSSIYLASTGKTVRFDIKKNDGRANGHTYVYKYITKSNCVYTDENKTHLRNTALRHYYSARGFNFFGINGIITKFNFIARHCLNYRDFLGQDIIECLLKNDYYKFMKEYNQYFENVYSYDENKKRKFLGVSFIKQNDTHTVSFSNSKYNPLNYVLIEKKIFSIFEANNEIKTDEEETIKNIIQLKNSDANITNALDIAISNQDSHDKMKDELLLDLESKGINVYHVDIHSEDKSAKTEIQLTLALPINTKEEKKKEKHEISYTYSMFIQGKQKNLNPEFEKPENPKPKTKTLKKKQQKIVETPKVFGFKLRKSVQTLTI
ncbi:replication endonuclease [Achromobacter xylosoxidans]|uniref:replication endonuclease n=1 Tax=Alcaligenes xylosoxydans xylosoxydans TaxID=85698 RepID=UPI0009D6B068|nr:replication endonuclease [Achromobacter xylosoxidans]